MGIRRELQRSDRRGLLSNSRYSYANPAAERANRPATRRGPPYVPRGEPSEMPRSHRRVPVPEATGLLRLAGPSGQPRPRPMARGQTLETTLARGPPPDKLAAHRGLESLAPEQTSRKKEQREKGNPGSQLPIIGAPLLAADWRRRVRRRQRWRRLRHLKRYPPPRRWMAGARRGGVRACSPQAKQARPRCVAYCLLGK